MRLIPWVLREVRRSSEGSRAVDGRQQGKIAAWIGHHAAAQRECVLVLFPPCSVVGHPAEEGLLEGLSAASGRRCLRVAVAGYVLIRRSGSIQSEFATGVRGNGECSLVDVFILVVVVFDLDAVVGVQTVTIRQPKIIFATP